MEKGSICKTIFEKSKVTARAAAAALALLLLLMAGSCGNPLIDNLVGDGSLSDSGGSQEIETGLHLTIPRFSPWLQSAVQELEPVQAGSRALAVADSFTVIVYDGSDTEVHNQSYTGGIAESQTCSIALAPASGYSVEVLVFNEDVSTTEAVVSGTADNITITEGETSSVTINCIPVSPTLATLDTPMTITDIVTSTWSGFYEVDNPGGEYWFSFTAPASGYVRFVPDFPSYSFHYVIGIYDQTGAPVKSFQSRVPTSDPLMAETVLTPDAAYYGVFLPLSDLEGGSQETISGSLALEAFDEGDCGYAEADAVSVSGTLDFSALTGAGYTVSSINIQVHPPDGSATGIMNIDSGDFIGNTVDYTLYNMDPSLDYNIHFQPEVDSGNGPEFVYYDPVTPVLSGGDVTDYDYAFGIDPFAPALAYGMHFIGNAAVILTFDQEMDNAAIENPANYSIQINSGTGFSPEHVMHITSTDPEAQSATYIVWDDAVNPAVALGDTLTIDVSADVISIEGIPMAEADRSISYPFQVDLSAAGFDETMITYDSPAARNVSIGVIGADPSTAAIFDTDFTPVNDGDGEDYLQVWAWEEGITGTFSGSTTNTPADLSAPWNSAMGTILTTDTYEAITINPETYYQYTLSYVDSNTGGAEMVLYSSDPVYMGPSLDLEETRVDVTINFTYTGALSTHGGGEVRGVLTYEDGGAAFAGQYPGGTSGTMTFNDYMVPQGEEVYLQLYYDLDESFSISAGDPVYRHPVAISADGGSATVTFDDTATCSASCPDVAGAWQISSSWGDMVITLTEDAFAIMRRTDSGSPTYGEVASINNYGTLTTVNNSEGYAIGQWTYHPAGAMYEGKFIKICWADMDGVKLTEMYHAYETEAEAIGASSDPTAISSPSMLW